MHYSSSSFPLIVASYQAFLSDDYQFGIDYGPKHHDDSEFKTTEEDLQSFIGGGRMETHEQEVSYRGEADPKDIPYRSPIGVVYVCGCA